MKSNPYQPPKTIVDNSTELDLETVISPNWLADRTRKIVFRFGLFQLLWPILCAYWMKWFALDIWALFIMVNGMSIKLNSFKNFPGTAVMLAVYPVAFAVSLAGLDVTNIRQLIPSRNAPVLLLQLVSTAWSVVAIYYLLRCYRSHRLGERRIRSG